MGPNQWIATSVALSGFVVWMTAMWIRAGRILQRIDDMASDQKQLKAQILQHATRITRLEVVPKRSH